MSGKHHSQQVLVAMMNNRSPAALLQQPTLTIMVALDWKNQMAVHDGKHSTCIGEMPQR